MIPCDTAFRWRRSGAIVHRALGAAVLALAVLSPSVLSAQPLPVTRLAYSAKYMCGSPNPLSWFPDDVVDATVVEVHNPHTTAVTCSVKVVQDYPYSQLITSQYAVVVPANGTLYFDCAAFGGPPPGSPPLLMGFVEIIAPRQIKVVAVYKQWAVAPGVLRSVAIAKKSCPFVIVLGTVRHSATCMFGDDVTAVGDTIRHETTVSVANLSNNVTNANISIVSKTGLVTSFLRVLPPNGFTTVTQADLPPATPLPFVGGVTVQYPDLAIGGYLEIEEIIKEYAVSGWRSIALAQSVVEVQPVTLR